MRNFQTKFIIKYTIHIIKISKINPYIPVLFISFATKDVLINIIKTARQLNLNISSCFLFITYNTIV